MKKIFYIDLFSGAGGTTTGIHLAGSEVIACVNHDAKAIESHRANHPDCVHYIEDIRDFGVVVKLKKQVDLLRLQHPDFVLIIWASLECTNYSKAKGGQPRDADSRTLAEHLFMYLEHLKPDYLQIENVREFMSWGPLDENGKPVCRLKGKDYLKWVDNVKSYGFDYDWRLLNAADYGSYQSRERFFGQFAKKGLPIAWPEPTHTKNPEKQNTLFGSPLEKWKPVREVLDLEDVGNSIFGRKKPLVEATLKRIYAGLMKFIAGGEDKWIIKYNSMNKRGTHNPPSLNEPSPVVSTQNRLGVVNAFFQKNYSGNPKGMISDFNRPSGTITCKDHHSLVFATSYYGNGGCHDVNQPNPTITCKDRFSLIKPQFMDNQYGTGGPTSIEKPNGTVTTSPKQALVTAEQWLMNTNFNNVGRSLNEPSPTILACRKHHYLMNPQFNDKGRSLDRPCFTLIAKMDKRPPYLIEANEGYTPIEICENDTPMMIKIKEFMILYGIVDIKMRMLKIPELLQIQGFPKSYILIGTQADQKKFIGNAVDVHASKALALASSNAINEHFKQTA